MMQIPFGQLRKVFRCIFVLCFCNEWLTGQSRIHLSTTSFYGSPEQIIHLHLTLSAASSVTLTTCMSFLTISIDFLFGLLVLLGRSILSILLPAPTTFLLNTYPNHFNLISLCLQIILPSLSLRCTHFYS